MENTLNIDVIDDIICYATTTSYYFGNLAEMIDNYFYTINLYKRNHSLFHLSELDVMKQIIQRDKIFENKQYYQDLAEQQWKKSFEWTKHHDEWGGTTKQQWQKQHIDQQQNPSGQQHTTSGTSSSKDNHQINKL